MWSKGTFVEFDRTQFTCTMHIFAATGQISGRNRYQNRVTV